jgi:hypothetical protein
VASPSGSLVDRMRGAAALDPATYNEVENDLQATGQAGIVVLIAALSSAIGGAGFGGGGILVGLLVALLGWALSSGVVYFIGTRFFGGSATWGEMLRVLGFAQAPGVLYALSIIPGLGWLIRLAIGIWIAVANYIAIREGLDLTPGKAFFVAIISAIVYGLVGGLFFSILF